MAINVSADETLWFSGVDDKFIFDGESSGGAHY
jgi:hypothetical protein